MYRDSTEQVVWTTDVLVGDIVLLAQGDEVPADGLWLDGQTIVIDESALTGESDPFKKNADKPSLFAGSLVTEHKGRMLVTAVGSNTTGGKIMELLNSVAKTATPLQEKLEKMAIDISKVSDRLHTYSPYAYIYTLYISPFKYHTHTHVHERTYKYLIYLSQPYTCDSASHPLALASIYPP